MAKDIPKTLQLTLFTKRSDIAYMSYTDGAQFRSV
jgi:hypothetical protein